MPETMMALYKDWQQADAVVDALLDSGIAHTDIELKSAHYWLDALAETDEALFFPMEGGEMVIEVKLADWEQGESARSILMASGPSGLHLHSRDLQQTWISLPMSVFYTSVQS